MKILQITPFFHPSVAGIENHVYNLSNNLSKRGHDVDILTINTENVKKEEIICGNINVYRCSLNIKYHKGLVSIEFVKRVLNAKNYDLCHIHIPFPFGLETTIVASKINKIPLIVTHHGEPTKSAFLYSIINSAYSKFYRNISLSFANKLIFLTESYGESLKLPERVKEKIQIVRSGVDAQRFSPQNDGTLIRKKYDFTDEDKIILFVGRLTIHNRYKGIDYLIKALSNVRHENNNAKLVIVGRGELVSELKELVKQLKLEQNVIFATSVSDEELPYYYAMCDYFVLPSISGPESFGIVLLEAMASEKPVIASDLPGVRDVVKDDENGLLVPPKDSGALADAIICLLENEEVRGRMGKNGRKKVGDYSWERIAEETEKVYNEVMNGYYGWR